MQPAIAPTVLVRGVKSAPVPIARRGRRPGPALTEPAQNTNQEIALAGKLLALTFKFKAAAL